MSPITHFLISWSVANTSNIDRKDRAVVTFAGILPDIDGAGIILDLLRSGSAQVLPLWSKYHHVLGHNIGFGIVLIIIAFFLSTRRLLTALLVFISFHLHLICDLLGSKGPDGYQWAIPYLLPFSNAWQWTWEHQWQLNAWPNFVITIVVIAITIFIAWKKAVSPLEMVSNKANKMFVETLRKRFGKPSNI